MSGGWRTAPERTPGPAAACRSALEGGEHLVGDVGVGVDGLDVVVVVDRLEQTQHLLGLGFVGHRDEGVGSSERSTDSGVMPASSRAWRTDSRSAGALVTTQAEPLLERSSAPPSMAISMTLSSSLSRPTVTIPLRSNCQRPAPGSAMLPPLRLKRLRISAPVRLRLSLSVSTMMATPPGP